MKGHHDDSAVGHLNNKVVPSWLKCLKATCSQLPKGLNVFIPYSPVTSFLLLAPLSHDWQDLEKKLQTDRSAFNFDMFI